jgi:hypothetical protein
LFAGGGLHSGDLAVWHEDGSAQILDRQKDIIISGTSPSFPHIYSPPPVSRLKLTSYRRREHLLRSARINASTTPRRPRSRRRLSR